MKRCFRKVLLFLLTASASCAGADLLLVDNGKPNAVIVIAKDALYQNELAAKELQHFLKKMSGAELPIVRDDQDVRGPKILIGKNRYTEKMDLKIPEGFSLDEIREEYLVKRDGESLILIGNDGGGGKEILPDDPKKRAAVLARQEAKRKANPYDLGPTPYYRGSLFAVYDFLESLGCRWYLPGEFFEVVPEMPTVKAGDIDRRVKPGFLMHGYWTSPGYVNRELGLDANIDHAAFFNRNRFLDFNVGYGGATDGSIMGPFKRIPKVKEEHPEYFALGSDGTRKFSALCMSNPDVIEIVKEAALAAFEKDPERRCIGFAPNDGFPACFCERCRAVNGEIYVLNMWNCKEVPCISGTYYHLMNEVAKAVREKFPDKIVSTSIYAGRILPPPDDEPMCGNIGGKVALIEHTLMHPITDPDNWQSRQIRGILKTWKARQDKICYRPYYPDFLVHCNIPMPLWQNRIKDTKYIAKCGINGFTWEGWPSFNTGLIDYYLASKLLWDPEADGDAIIDEFFSTFYGPAAEPVKRFYRGLEDAIVNAPFNTHEEGIMNELYTWELLNSLMPLVDEAEKAVANAKGPYKKRVALFRMTAEHAAAYAQMRDVAERRCDFAKAAELARKMAALEDEMLKICPAFIDPSNRRYDLGMMKDSGPFAASRTPFGKETQYNALNKLMDGTDGRLIRILPENWKLKLDAVNNGLVEQWYSTSTDLSDWQDIKIGRPLEVQGIYTDRKTLLPYLGEAWYALDFEIGKDFRAADAMLLACGINNEAWVWINGKFAGHQPFHAWWARWSYIWKCPLANLLRKGKNRIVVRVRCGDRYGFGGIFRGMFLYEQIKTAPEKNSK